MTNPEAWSDEPIDDVQQDSFCRKPFAKLLAETIDDVQLGAASTVFGLVGPWGSGKSSVAAMVREMLPNSWVTQSFTPWAAAGTAALQLEFVAALDAAIDGGIAKKDAAHSALRRYAKWASPVLAAMPVIGKAVADTTNMAVEEATARQPWSVEFGALAELLKTMNKRVLIVCDDIDRLDALELLEFLKVVRLLGRFPNVHYLVAYDADTVEDLLAAQGIRGRTSSFMEKIVQHPFELPQIDEATRWRHISTAMTKSLDAQGVRLDESGMERYRLLVDALTSGLVTPRQIARYENHLNVLSKLVPGEVDPLDFAALANLRLNHHEIYEALPRWTSDLLAGVAGKSNEEGQLTSKEWTVRLTETSRRADITGAWESICFLFPGIHDLNQKRLHPQAFSDGRYTERYYSLGVPENDVSDVMVSRAITSLLGRRSDVEAEAAISKIMTDAHPSVARLALEKLRDHRRALLDGNDPVRKIVIFLLSEYERARPSRNELDSAIDVVYNWLSDEVLRGYSAGEFSRGELLQLLGEKLSLGILLRVKASRGSVRQEDVLVMLTDFADHFRDLFIAEGRSALEPLSNLRLRLSLISKVHGDQALSGLLDPIVDGDVLAFESVATAMVRTEKWFGGGDVRQNLAFEQQEWLVAVSSDVRKRMAGELTEEFDIEPVDTDDVSKPNRRRLAIVSVRSEFGLVRGVAGN